ncbi:S1 RNA-binding domain-containing protein [Streptomyces sp. NPDC048483]|uniref:S1 RNA-binding domain-containing protein n=1 Tax=Streptomyces sp. NPDC048483 TaxID=3154927 RepID=UPI00342A1375
MESGQVDGRARRSVLDSLEPGQVHRGVVSAVRPFGVFVDLGGLDGMVNVSELSWVRFDDPAQIADVGQEVTVMVLDVDRQRERVALSLAGLFPDPLREFARTQIGAVIPGRVTKTVPFGVFVHVHEGCEGLVPGPRLAEHGVDDPEAVPIGTEVLVEVAEVNVRTRRILLGLRRLGGAPA